MHHPAVMLRVDWYYKLVWVPLESKFHKTFMKKSKEEYPLLIAQEGPLKGQRWPLSQTIVLGREATCDVVVPDRQIARFHARLTPTTDGVMIEDLGSKNGTYHNGVLLSTPVVLQDGDQVAVGIAQQFLYLTSDATVPLLEGGKPGRLMVDHKSRMVWVRQQQLVPPLSAQQFKLLWLLYESQGQVVSRPDLVAAVWGDDQSMGVSDQALDALIRRLRDRIAALDPTHPYIDTVRGHGIKLNNPSL
jgi:Transcriptional regulatory protein, C terminal/FHA domain